MVSSSFDESVCCLCTRSTCSKCGMYTWLVMFNIICAISGMICCIIYFSGSRVPEVMIASFVLHFFSLACDLIFSTYPFRFWNGMEGDEEHARSHAPESVFSFKFGIYSLKTYLLLIVYIIAIIMLFSLIGVQSEQTTWSDEHNRKQFIQRASDTSLAIIMYYYSFCIALLWTLFRKPIMTDREEKVKSSHYMENKLVNIDSGSSLAFLFGISYVTMNATLGIYYIDTLLQSVLYYGSMSMCLISAISLAIIVITEKRVTENTKFSWCVILTCVSISAIALFIFALAGLETDLLFPGAIFRMWISFLIQGAIPLIFIACFIVYVLFIAFMHCTLYCRTTIRESIDEAKKTMEKNEQTGLIN